MTSPMSELLAEGGATTEVAGVALDKPCTYRLEWLPVNFQMMVEMTHVGMFEWPFGHSTELF